MEPITSAAMIIDAARKLSERKKRKHVAVASAADTAVLEAVSTAESLDICDATLFGDDKEIRQIADSESIDISNLELRHFSDPTEAAYNAVKMADGGDADVIMKGLVATSALLKTVLSKGFNLRGKNPMSHTAVLDIPGYHKLFGITDGGMIVKPDFETKLQLIENGSLIFNALGFEKPKVALSSAVDYVHENFPSTILNKRIMDFFEAGKIPDCEVFGPLTLEAAISKEIAAQRGIESPVAGDADLFVVDSIEECNIVSKVLILFIKATFAGVIVGAKVPVSLVSRTDTVENKKASLSIACLVADYLAEERGAA
ncbi:MAG: phosphate acyltransferase [Candidatus Zixiibacteriota bacterium]